MAVDATLAPPLPAKLPRLRKDLDVMASPVAEQPGLLMRDPYRYSEETLVVPMAVLPLLRLLDGACTAERLVKATEQVVGLHDADDVARDLVATLSEAGFLEDDVYARRRDDAHRTFAHAAVRSPSHAGQGYPEQAADLAKTLDGYLDDGRRALLSAPRAPRGEEARLLGLAAPHVSPFGGPETYGAAYSKLPPSLGDRTFVLLGTSHYGEPDKFGLTHKPFATPLGQTETDTPFLTALEKAADKSIVREDYCHVIEHSLEFQVVFLQKIFGPRVRIVPILCGPFTAGPTARPEADDGVASFIDALGNQAAKRGEKLFFVLGVDMAHVGKRYGDATRATAHRGAMSEVAERDHARLACLTRGEADGFWAALQEKGEDDLRWCGASPLYTFSRALPEARGRILKYDQWNIDPASVVSFAALRFSRAAEATEG